MHILYALIHEKSNKQIVKILRNLCSFSFAGTICLMVFYRFSIEVMNNKDKTISITAASIRKLLEEAGAGFP